MLGPVLTPSPRRLTPEARRYPVPDGAAALIAERPPAHPAGGALWIAVFLTRLWQAPRPVEKVKVFAVLPPSSGWPILGELTVSQVNVVAGADTAPAARALPDTVVEVDAEHTAAAVLSTPGLLAEWWKTTLIA